MEPRGQRCSDNQPRKISCKAIPSVSVSEIKAVLSFMHSLNEKCKTQKNQWKTLYEEGAEAIQSVNACIHARPPKRASAAAWWIGGVITPHRCSFVDRNQENIAVLCRRELSLQHNPSRLLQVCVSHCLQSSRCGTSRSYTLHTFRKSVPYGSMMHSKLLKRRTFIITEESDDATLLFGFRKKSE